jgi:hypothetical protein
VRRLALNVVLIVASFAFWHSGARADGLCERERFVGSGALSAWPPGARCTYGEPATSDTLLNPWFFGTLLLVLLLAMGLGELMERASLCRTRSSRNE